MKKEDQITILEHETIQDAVYVCCTHCHAEECQTDNNPAGFAGWLYLRGWRVSTCYVKCPECAKDPNVD